MARPSIDIYLTCLLGISLLIRDQGEHKILELLHIRLPGVEAFWYFLPDKLNPLVLKMFLPCVKSKKKDIAFWILIIVVPSTLHGKIFIAVHWQIVHVAGENNPYRMIIFIWILYGATMRARPRILSFVVGKLSSYFCSRGWSVAKHKSALDIILMTYAVYMCILVFHSCRRQRAWSYDKIMLSNCNSSVL